MSQARLWAREQITSAGHREQASLAASCAMRFILSASCRSECCVLAKESAPRHGWQINRQRPLRQQTAGRHIQRRSRLPLRLFAQQKAKKQTEVRQRRTCVQYGKRYVLKCSRIRLSNGEAVEIDLASRSRSSMICTHFTVHRSRHRHRHKADKRTHIAASMPPCERGAARWRAREKRRGRWA